MELLYQEKLSVYKTEQNWSILSYTGNYKGKSIFTDENSLIFYPQDFKPDKNFGKKVIEYWKRSHIKLLWIENPESNYTDWNCVSCSESNLIIYIGKYRIGLKQLLEENSNQLIFSGSFVVGMVSLPISPEKIYLDLSNSCGTIRFSFIGREDIFLVLDSGIQFVMPILKDIKSSKNRNSISKFKNSVLQTYNKKTETIQMEMICTPCAIQNKELTYIQLPETKFLSSFLSTDGSDVSLIPCKNAKLVFEKTAAFTYFNNKEQRFYASGLSWYLGLCGSFKSDCNNILLGLSSTEYFEMSKNLHFIPHQNALIQKTKIPTDSKPIVTTSWLSFDGAYYSSSKSMPFFSVRESYLRMYTPCVQKFNENSPAIPVMLWKNAVFKQTEEAKQAEECFINSRYWSLVPTIQSKTALRNIKPIIAITPCGICVSIESVSGKWNWIGIAQTSNKNLPNICLQSPSEQIKAILQKQDCILITATSEEFCKNITPEGIIKFPVGGWEIVISKQYWSDNTLFMLKYTDSCSIRSCLSETPQFQHILEEAYSSDGVLKEEYKSFIQIIDDNSFQGIFILEAIALDTLSLSPEFAALTSGISKGQIKSKYTIIKRSKVSISEDGQISVSNSDIQSLFFYKGKSLKSSENLDFDFRTVGLTVVIEKSIIHSFYSRSELMLAKLFGSRIYPINSSDGNCLVLNGNLEMIGEKTICRFTLSSPITFEVSNSAINQFTVNSVKLVSNKDSRQSSKNLDIFIIEGTMSFICIEECDIFSYGNPPILFTGLNLIKDNSGIVADYSNITLLYNTTSPRDKSFAQIFGAVITECLFGMKNSSPDKMGFSSIIAPVKQNSLETEWNGVIWKITIGSSGELGKDNPLSFEIMTAWSNKNIYIGLRLPGVFKNSFSLQGLITAGFSSIELVDGGNKKLFFKFHGFTLKLLGMSFPKKGAELLIIGKNGKTAWYASYIDIKEEDKNA